MAAVTLGVDSPDTTASPVASGAFTPAAGDLLIVICGASVTVAAAPTCTSSVGGQTFSLILVQLQASTHQIAAFVSNAFATAVSQTVTVTHTGDASTGQVQTVLLVSGMTRTGLDAILQSASTEGPGATPAVTFPAATLTTNAVIAGIRVFANPPAITEPASFTEHSDSGYATPTAGQETASRNSGHTSATVTWGSAIPGLAWSAVILELDTTAAGAATSANAGLAQGIGHI